jgi:hypothetical protein
VLQDRLARQTFVRVVLFTFDSNRITVQGVTLKVKAMVKSTLEQAMNAHRGSRDIALFFV